MYRLAKAHFKRVDPRLHAASLEHDIADLKASDDLFRDIVWTIIGQQLSGKAADTIFARFEKLLRPANPRSKKLMTPQRVLALTEPQMRSAGLSGAKARAVKSLAEHVLSGDLSLEALPALPDEQVLAELTRVKGIGPWTAEMVLMFSLGRADVFSPGDLGLRKGIMYLYGLKRMPSERMMRNITAAWKPYRTYASRVLWRIADAARTTPRIGRKRPGNKKS